MKKYFYLTTIFIVLFFNYSFSQSWSLTGNAGTTPATNFLGTTDNKPLVLRTKNLERLRILADGKIGIGTKTPSERLHVLGNELLDGDLTMASTLGKGDINFTTDQQNIAFAAPGSSSSAMIYMTNASTVNRRMVLARDISNGSTGLSYEFSSDAFNFMKGAVSKLRIDLTNGRVGINDNTPSYPLDVNGNVQIIGNVGIQTAPGSRTLQVGATQGALLGIGTIEYIQDGGANMLSCNAGLFPVTDNTYTLGNSGFRWNSVWAADGTINTSDARDKTNIRDLNYGLKDIMKLHAVRFNWKTKPDEGDKLGVIAQEIKKVLPEVVRDWEYKVDEQTGIKTKVPSEKLGVMYADIIPVLIKGMQEQQKEIEDLKKLVEQLSSNSAVQQNATTNTAEDNFSLAQNSPNPFSNSTTIFYNLKKMYKNVQLVVSNNAGNTIKVFAINNQSGKIIFNASGLTAGTYYYALIADQKTITTKTMMIN